MKIDLTEKEYRTLLEIFEIASWVLRAHKAEKDPETQTYDELEQKIFSYAKDSGLENLITWDDELGEYSPTEEYEESSPAMRFMEEFENDSFWDELIERLVERDLIRQEGEEKILKMDTEERLAKEEPLRGKYYSEFLDNGIDNLKIEA